MLGLKKISFFFKDFIFYGVITGFNKLSVLLTFPFLARYFSVEDFGKLDFLINLISLTIVIIVFGQDSAIGRYIQEQKKLEGKKIIISNSLFIHLIALILIISILLLYKSFFLPYFYNDDFFNVILLQIPILLFISFSENIFKWTFSKIKFLVISLSNFLIIIFSSFFVIILKKDILSFFIFSIMGQIILSIICLFFLINLIKINFNQTFITSLLVYGMPFGIVCIISVLVPILERIFVQSYVGDYELGLYSVAVKISLCLTILAQAFQTAWGPFSLKNFNIINSDKIFNFILFVFSTILSLLVIIITFFSKEIILILASNKYSECYLLIFPICFGYSIQFIGWILEIGIHISKKTYLIFFGYIAYLSSSLISLIILCNFFGIIGVAISVPIGFLVKTMVDLKVASSCWKKIWRLKRIIFLKTYTFLLCTILLITTNNNILISKWVVLFLLLIHFIYFWIFLDRYEINAIKSIELIKRIGNKFL